jgi:DNA-binding NtrC family response regulator
MCSSYEGNMARIDLALVICKQGEDRDKIVAALLKCGLSPICCVSLGEARTLLSQEEFRVVLCSDILPDGDYRMVLREAKKSPIHTPVIVLSRSAEWDSYLNALGVGAFDFIVCPPSSAEAERILWSALAATMRPDKITPTAV